MSAFTAKGPAVRDAFMARWTRILADETITTKTILLDGRVAGHALRFEQLGKPEVSCWISKDDWGNGIATEGLSRFLGHVTMRPLYARVASDHLASIRVLLKCGFTIAGEDKGFSHAGGGEAEEVILNIL